jgi:hypothetical protein
MVEMTFSHREKVAAEQPDEGLRRRRTGLERRIPSPVAGACPRAGQRPDTGGDTLSLWERVTVVAQ